MCVPIVPKQNNSVYKSMNFDKKSTKMVLHAHVLFLYSFYKGKKGQTDKDFYRSSSLQGVRKMTEKKTKNRKIIMRRTWCRFDAI